jgi:hypothetical protein
MKTQISIIRLVTLLLVVLLIPDMAIAGETALKKPKTYQVTVIIHSDYSTNVEELNHLQNMIKMLPNDGRSQVGTIRFYRSDSELLSEYKGTSINYRDRVFMESSSKRACTQAGIEEWMNCSMKNYPRTGDYSHVILYNRNQPAGNNMVQDLNQKQHEVLSNMIDVELKMIAIARKLKNNDHILLMHYFQPNTVKQEPVVKTDRCDTMETHIAKNLSRCTPSLVNLDPDWIIRPERYAALNDEYAYHIIWSKADIFDQYELVMNGISFKVDAAPANKFGKDAAYVLNNQVHFYLSEQELGKQCSRKYNADDNKDCLPCDYNCIYNMKWEVKVRGITCEDKFGPYSPMVSDMLFQCAKK